MGGELGVQGIVANGGEGDSDVHIYYFQENAEQKKFAKELWERIRRECEFCCFFVVGTVML